MENMFHFCEPFVWFAQLSTDTTMSRLLSKKRAAESSQIQNITPSSAGWNYVGFEAHELGAEESVTLESGDDREMCVVVLRGRVDLASGDETWHDIGNRDSVFDDVAPYAIYLPPASQLVVSAKSDCELAVARAPGAGRFPVRLITPDMCSIAHRGVGSNTRTVRNILFDNLEAESLLVCEVITPPGNWSSYPPHKHDRDAAPQETALEETYYHQVRPSQGFVFQRVYTDDRSIDETMSVENQDVVMVPRGYHPVGVPHGYESYYLNVMAGPSRNWIFHNDPDHEWILEADKSKA